MKYSKVLLKLLMAAGLMVSCHSQKQITSEEKFIDDLMSKMTLEEKLGQMTQVTIQVVSDQPGNTRSEHTLDISKLESAILDYHVGSILNVWDKAHTPDHWHEVIRTIQETAQRTPNKIPVLYGIDAIHGATYTQGATLFPQSIAMAAARNPELTKLCAKITAIETRASGIPWNFNPVLGMGRMPLWPRLWETFGEDTYLTSVLGKAYVEGLQGENLAADDAVVACAKHYLGYSGPVSGKDRTPALIPERVLRETFLPPFAEAVKAGALTVMVNSSEINGEPVHASHFYMTELLKGELGFEGFIVSDWNDINNLWQREKVAKDQREAVKMSVLAGMDMSMVPYDFSFYTQLLSLVQDGEVPMSRIDDAVHRILTVKYRLGLFTNAVPDEALKSRIAAPEHRAANLEAAREVITLLKNDNALLPLKKDVTILVTGPTSNRLSVLNGGWTITWQGNEESLYPPENKTILEAIQAKIGEKNVVWSQGSSYDQDGLIRDAAAQCKNVDAAVVCLGEDAYCETPGNINDLALPQVQYNLVNDIAAAGKPVILVLAEGRPRLVSPVVEKCDAVMLAYLPGLEGGNAIADVLFGDVNPSGKLPYSYPRYANDLLTYDHKNSEETPPNQYNPQWPFGFGLSYTTFEYENLRLSSETISKDKPLTITVTLKNTGKRTGKEVVELYVRDEVASITPPVKKLRAFKKIELKPGEAQDVEFTLTSMNLAFVNSDLKWVTEPGDFTVSVAGLSAGFSLK